MLCGYRGNREKLERLKNLLAFLFIYIFIIIYNILSVVRESK